MSKNCRTYRKEKRRKDQPAYRAHHIQRLRLCVRIRHASVPRPRRGQRGHDARPVLRAQLCRAADDRRSFRYGADAAGRRLRSGYR